MLARLNPRRLFGSRSGEPTVLRPLGQFVETVDADGFDPETIQQNSFIRRAPTQEFGPLVPFLTEDRRVVEPYFVARHRGARGPSGDVGCYVLVDARYDPAVFTAADADGAVLTADNVMPRYWQDDLAAMRLRPDARRENWLGGTFVACLSPYLKSYGHILLETLPRLWLLRDMVGPAWSGLRFLIDDQCPEWFGRLLVEAGVEASQCVRVRRGRGRLRVDRLLIPGPMHSDFCFHPMAMEHFDRVPGAPTSMTSSKIYVSRGPADLRRLANEADIIPWIERRGFTVVEPWRLPWPEQVALFRQAEVIVGAYGSALHNAVFSPGNAKVIAFGFVNHIQACIATAREQGFCLVRPSRDERRKDGYVFEMSTEAIGLALEAAGA